MRILGLIPARAGSKGIPRKNLRPFRGRPLLAWTCEAARAASALARVVLSTDDPEMAELARTLDVEVPFMRPAELARDDTATLPVVQHALEALGERFDAVCLLQPTNPLRSPADIDAACELLATSSADSVVSVVAVPSHVHPMWTYLLDEDGALVQAVPGDVVPRRQDLPPAYTRDGSIYVTRSRVILEADSLYGRRVVPYMIAAERSGGIDTFDDLEALEAKARRNG